MVVGDRIMEVPQIDYHAVPNGIITAPDTTGGMQIASSFTHTGAERLASQLRATSPPVKLTVTRAPR